MLVDGVKQGSLSLLSIGTRASRDLALWDFEASQLQFSVNIDQSIDFTVVSAARKAVVCGGADTGVILAISLTSGSLQQTSRAEEYRGMMDLTVSADSIFVATTASGVVIISMTRNVVIGNLHDPAGRLVPTKLLVNSHNDGQLIVGYKHGVIHMFDVDTATVICCLPGHSGQINSLHQLPSGQLVSASSDQCGIIWNRDLCMDKESVDELAGVSEMWTKCKLRGPETGEVVCSDGWETEVNYRVCCYTVDSTQHLLYAGFSCGVIQVFSLDTGQFSIYLSLS